MMVNLVIEIFRPATTSLLRGEGMGFLGASPSCTFYMYFSMQLKIESKNFKLSLNFNLPFKKRGKIKGEPYFPLV